MELIKSNEALNEKSKLSKQDSLNNRLARYIDRVRNLEVENKERCLKDVEKRLAEQHEIHADAIQELREKYENQMKVNREEIETVYDGRIKTVQNGAKRDGEALADALSELKIAQSRIDDSNAKIVILKQINLSLHDRINDLQTALESVRSRSAKNVTEINHLREEMAALLKEHLELMDAKQCLAVEIALYGKLLSDAEQPRSQLSPSLAAAASRKRKRDDLNSRN